MYNTLIFNEYNQYLKNEYNKYSKFNKEYNLDSLRYLYNLLLEKYNTFILMFNDFAFNIKYISFSLTTNFNIYILKDDFYLVNINQKEYYICDQIDGVIKLINDVQERKFYFEL